MQQAIHSNLRSTFSRPYLNVMRMHLLILLFGFICALGLDVYQLWLLVYAVYFFPWRMFKRQQPATVGT